MKRDFETFHQNRHVVDRNICTVIQFQCFRGWDYTFFQNECDEGNMALEVDYDE